MKAESREIVSKMLPEIAQHLDETPTTAKLVPLDNWAAMAGITKGRFVYAFKMEDEELYNKYRFRLKKYIEDLQNLLLKAESTSFKHLQSISEIYDMPLDALQAIARRLGRSAPSRRTIFGEKLAAVAKVGMTIGELAKVANLNAGSLKSAKNLGKIEDFVKFETSMMKNPSGSKTWTSVVSWVKEVKRGRKSAR
jgi:hypothetical protein